MRFEFVVQCAELVARGLMRFLNFCLDALFARIRFAFLFALHGLNERANCWKWRLRAVVVNGE